MSSSLSVSCGKLSVANKDDISEKGVYTIASSKGSSILDASSVSIDSFSTSTIVKVSRFSSSSSEYGRVSSVASISATGICCESSSVV